MNPLIVEFSNFLSISKIYIHTNFKSSQYKRHVISSLKNKNKNKNSYLVKRWEHAQWVMEFKIKLYMPIFLGFMFQGKN